MPLSVLKNINGPDWPLGLITVAASGTPVGIMSLVDPNSYNAPETVTSTNTQEYSAGRCYDIIFWPVKSVNTVTANTGYIYIVRYSGRTVGTGNKADTGVMIATVPNTQLPFHLSSVLPDSAPPKFNPYDYYIDADNTGDGALVTLLI